MPFLAQAQDMADGELGSGFGPRRSTNADDMWWSHACSFVV